MSVADDRVLPLAGVSNVRDFGGYASRHGAMVRRGRLFRSGAHAGATAQDLAYLDALGLAGIVDLRRPNECAREPSPRGAGFSGVVLACGAGQGEDDPWWTFAANSDLSRESIQAYLTGYYRALPFEARYTELFGRYFALLARTGGPLLIHCTAGKDRTGLLAALTLALLGVSHEDILRDYLLTNQAHGLQARVERLLQRIVERKGHRPAPAAVRAAVEADATYLQAAFAAIDARHGSLDTYLAEVLGVDPGLRRHILEQLLS